MLLPVLPSVTGFEALETFVSDDYLSHGDLVSHISSFWSLLAGILRNMLAIYIWEYKPVGVLTSGKLPVCLPGSQQHGLYYPSSIIFPTLYSSSLCSRKVSHPYDWATFLQTGCIWVLHFLGWGGEEGNGFIGVVGLGLWDEMWHVLFQQQFISPLVQSNSHPPLSPLNKTTSISIWEICPVAQLEINKCNKQMGGIAPKCTVMPAGVLSLLSGAGLWEAGCDGLVLARSLAFQSTATCSSKDLSLSTVSSLKCGESQLLDS